MSKEDAEYQYIPFPIEYMDKEEATKYQTTLLAKKGAEDMRENAHAEYLTAIQRANAIREKDELEYFLIKRDAKAALKKGEELYLPIIQSSE